MPVAIKRAATDGIDADNHRII